MKTRRDGNTRKQLLRRKVLLIDYQPERSFGCSRRMIDRILMLEELPEVFDASEKLNRNSMPAGTTF